MTFDDARIRAGHGGEALAEAAAVLARLESPPAATVPGRLGELVLATHALLGDAVAARSREAAAHGARLLDIASSLHQAGGGYVAVDAEAERRHGEGGQ